MNIKRFSKDSPKKRKKSFWIIISILLIIIFIIALSFLVNYKKFNISKINIYGADMLDQKAILENIENSLSGKYYILFSKRNFLIYPKEQVYKNLYNQFPVLSSVESYVTESNTLQVDLKLRKAFALWCQRYDDRDFPKCFFLDDNGFVFSPAPDFSGDAYLKYFGFLPFGDPVGSNFLNSPQSFKNLSDFINKLKKIGISPLYTEASTTSSFEINIDKDSKILFNLDYDLNQTFDRLSVFINSKEWLSENLKLTDLEYLDLRFGNKVFYKLKNPK